MREAILNALADDMESFETLAASVASDCYLEPAVAEREALTMVIRLLDEGNVRALWVDGASVTRLATRDEAVRANRSRTNACAWYELTLQGRQALTSALAREDNWILEEQKRRRDHSRICTGRSRRAPCA